MPLHLLCFSLLAVGQQVALLSVCHKLFFLFVGFFEKKIFFCSMHLGERTTFCLSCMFCLTTTLFIVPIERKIPPSFTKKPSGTIEDTEGKMVKIEGRVAGSQPLTVNWYKDGLEIFTSDFYDVTFKSSLAVLCIKKSQLSDSGTYMCKISNEAGTASYDVSVKITGIQLVSMSNFSYFNCLVISVLLLEKKYCGSTVVQ